MLEPRILKGTRDHGPLTMAKRDYIMRQIVEIFQNYGYDTIETPVIEYAEMILGKYGDEGDKLTYHFQDNGDRHIALRYDQTVPFARYFAMNHNDLPKPFKRYQISRVWRADKPQRGRLREFYQCDIDIIGTDSLLAELECVLVINDVLTKLGFADFEIQFNDRRILTAVLESVEVSSDQTVTVIRILDKLDKIGIEAVKRELQDIGLAEDQIQQLESLLLQPATNSEKLERLKNYKVEAVSEIFAQAEAAGVDLKRLNFNPALARGLDYYTGIIFEVVLLEDRSLGTICAGGRYANLCGMFCNDQFSGVGVAFGFERLVEALQSRELLTGIGLASQVLIVNFGSKLDSANLQLATTLRAAGINTEYYFEDAKLAKQFKYADKKQIPYVAVQGEGEQKRGVVVLKNMQTGEQQELNTEQLVAKVAV